MQLHWILHNLAPSVMRNAAVIRCVASLLVRLPQYIMQNNAAVVMQAPWVKITLRDHPRLEARAIKVRFRTKYGSFTIMQLSLNKKQKSEECRNQRWIYSQMCSFRNVMKALWVEIEATGPLLRCHGKRSTLLWLKLTLAWCAKTADGQINDPTWTFPSCTLIRALLKLQHLYCIGHLFRHPYKKEI